jgi:hypothetical protein
MGKEEGYPVGASLSAPTKNTVAMGLDPGPFPAIIRISNCDFVPEAIEHDDSVRFLPHKSSARVLRSCCGTCDKRASLRLRASRGH